jgi:hypothetical protein
MTRILRTSLALAALVVVIALLHFAARFDLRGPTGFGSDELSTWVDDPVTAIATIIRWIALLLAYYLTVVVLGVAVFADGLEKSPLGQLVPTGLVASIGLLLGISAVGVPLATHMASSNVEVASERTAPLALRQIDDPLSLQSIPVGIPDDDGHPMIQVTHPTSAARAIIDDLFTVSAGDSFWSIAEETLVDQGHQDPSETDIATYWRTLISANEDRLIEPSNPDLILPGQEFTLPPTP